MRRSVLRAISVVAIATAFTLLTLSLLKSTTHKRIYTLDEAQSLPVRGANHEIDSAEEAIATARRMNIEGRVEFESFPADTDWLVIAELGPSRRPPDLLPYWRVTYLANGTPYSCTFAISRTGERLSDLESCGWAK